MHNAAIYCYFYLILFNLFLRMHVDMHRIDSFKKKFVNSKDIAIAIIYLSIIIYLSTYDHIKTIIRR